MNIALHNFYHLPQLLSRGGIHNYVLELIKQGKIRYLFFDDKSYKNLYGVPITSLIDQIKSLYSWKDLGLSNTEIIFSAKTLKSKADVLLNFNGVIDNDMVPAVKNFNGLKIFHVMDFFWLQPGSVQYKKLKEMGVDYLMSYGSSDKYNGYFQKTFPDYLGKVIPVPFGFTPKYKVITPFDKRIKKCIALGSVLPNWRGKEPEFYWKEQAKFYKGERWLHKFRRMLVENRKNLSDIMDSFLPIFPKISDHSRDFVQVFNNYQMFVACESIYYFPSAKTFEGTAAGCIQVCSTHPCFSDLGFKDGVNCIKHREFDIEDFREKVSFYLKHQDKLKKIGENGTKLVRENYSHATVANNLYNNIKKIYERWGKSHSDNIESDPKINLDFSRVWTNPYNNRFKQYSPSMFIRMKNRLIVFVALVISFLHLKVLGPLWTSLATRLKTVF